MAPSRDPPMDPPALRSAAGGPATVVSRGMLLERAQPLRDRRAEAVVTVRGHVRCACVQLPAADDGPHTCRRTDDQEAEPRHRSGRPRPDVAAGEVARPRNLQRRHRHDGVAVVGVSPPGRGVCRDATADAADEAGGVDHDDNQRHADDEQHGRLPPPACAPGVRVRSEPHEAGRSAGGGVPHGARPRSCAHPAVTATATGCRGWTPAVAGRVR
jgi:hypothetical protein